MTETRQCSHCGGELPADAPLGLCPRCVLNVGANSQMPTMGSGDGHPALSPASAFVPPAPADLAARFPQLEILELLGQGGMGAVYKARQPGLDRLVALKILPPGMGADPAFAERFTREARSLARLNHPNVVAVYDFGQAGDLYYFLMEYIDGVNLREMQRVHRLDPAQALEIVIKVCEALQYAHDEGIVHRDIKPENLLIDKKGRVKIADFGLAKLLAKAPTDFTLTHPDQRIGTPAYMAPEQVERPAEVDQRADIYSLGVVFYEMLTGELPLGRFQAPSQMVHVDVRLDEVVLKTLEKEPARRYQHASEVKTDVEQITGTPLQAAPATILPAQAAAQNSVKGRKSRTAWIVAAIIAGALLILAVPIILAVLAAFYFVAHTQTISSSSPSERHAPSASVESPESDGPRITTYYWGHYPGTDYPGPDWEKVIAKTGVEVDRTLSSTNSGQGSLKVMADGPTTVRLFEHGPTAGFYKAGPYDVDNSRLTYQAKLRTWGLQGRAYLEMWCHFPDGGEYFSRGLDKPLSGTNDWTSVETSFLVTGAREPDNVRLNLVVDGKGTVWIDDVGLTLRPPPAKRGG